MNLHYQPDDEGALLARLRAPEELRHRPHGAPVADWALAQLRAGDPAAAQFVVARWPFATKAEIRAIVRVNRALAGFVPASAAALTLAEREDFIRRYRLDAFCGTWAAIAAVASPALTWADRLACVERAEAIGPIDRWRALAQAAVAAADAPLEDRLFHVRQVADFGWRLALRGDNVPLAIRMLLVGASVARDATEKARRLAGRLGAHAPGLSDDERMLLADASDAPAEWRAQAAAWAPYLDYRLVRLWAQSAPNPVAALHEAATLQLGLTSAQRSELRKIARLPSVVAAVRQTAA